MFYKRLVLCLSALLLISCGGQGGYSGSPSGTYVVNVSVSGLPNNGNARVVVQNNGTSTLTFINNGTQSFPSQQLGTPNSVSVLTQPSPLNCVVSAPSGTNPVNVNVTCSEMIVYVTNYGTSKLSALSIGAGGVLTQLPGGLVATDINATNPTSVVIHPNGQYAYVSNYSTTNPSISVFNWQSGSLRLLTNVPMDSNLESGPYKLVLSPNGSYLYCVNIISGTISVFAVIGGGAVLTPLIGSPLSVRPGINSIAIDPTNSYVYVSGGTANSTIYEFQIQTNGSLQLHSQTSVGISAPTSVVVSPTGNFVYVVNSTTNNVTVFSIGGGGMLSYKSTSPHTGTTPHDIAFSPNGAYAYVTNYGTTQNPATLSQFKVDTSTGPTAGALTAMNPATVNAGLSPAAGPYAIVVDPTGYSVFSSNYNEGTISQYLITGTGSLSVASPTFTTSISAPTSIAIH